MKVPQEVSQCERVLVILDSDHTKENVLGVLNLCVALVLVGSYCDVLDAAIERTAGLVVVDSPWQKDENPKTSVQNF